MRTPAQIARTIALLPILTASAAWNDSDLFVESVYRQIDNTGSVIDSVTPYAFRASVKDTYSLQVQQLVLPNNAGHAENPVTTFLRTGAHHVFFFGAPSVVDLSAKFPVGNYQWSISGGNSGGALTPAMQVTVSSPPSAQPQIVGGVWANGRLKVLASDPRFQITPWQSPPSGSNIEFELWRAGGAGGSAMSPGTTVVSWSPQPVGAIFDAFLSLRTPLSEIDTPKPTGGLFHSRAGIAATLYFQIEVVESLETSQPFPFVEINPAVQLRWLSALGRTYQVQWSENLQQWTNLGASLAGTGSYLTFTDPQGSAPRKFYQVLESVTVAPTNLVILEARYGAGGVESDVRTYINQNIVSNTVNMNVGNSTLGGDPVPGQVKALYIRYENTAGQFQTTIQEGGTLKIPDATHQPVP
ncbi:MAG: hypothetical protein ABL962_09850 [Fimbriimonadaceae bacterium]